MYLNFCHFYLASDCDQEQLFDHLRDPLLNPNLVKNRDRQQAILKGLSELRQVWALPKFGCDHFLVEGCVLPVLLNIVGYTTYVTSPHVSLMYRCWFFLKKHNFLSISFTLPSLRLFLSSMKSWDILNIKTTLFNEKRHTFEMAKHDQ